ncbi:hypothetical protein [Uliginosibacterium sp. TH139]|uniref:hypothetical protein n=1 Tax=Uliginosibacterium sp. TH139 TaxID=2067453 RepID=UPI00117E1185|nr:hypothetical protein [Uliginosibacterium sp. TH139]
MSEDDKNLPAICSTSMVPIEFPAVIYGVDQECGEKTRDLIQQTSVYTPGGEAFVDKDTVPHLLATDKKGVNRVYNNLNNEDKLEDGTRKFISVPALQKELSTRIQEPRDAIERERLRDSEACVVALRDAPLLEKMRVLEESKNREEQPRLKAKKIKAEGIDSCQLTGQPLQADAHAHHVERRADKPRKARDLKNVIVVNPKPHQEIHRQGAESPEELKALCEKEGWANPLVEKPSE